MPNYDFFCQECGDTIMVAVSITQEVQTPICAKCKAEMTRSFGIQAIQFKGRGWASKER